VGEAKASEGNARRSIARIRIELADKFRDTFAIALRGVPALTASRHILHVDMDSFYVSVERLRDPSLIGKPVIVGGPPNSRGVVSSASYEARKFGVRSAMPSATAAKLCPSAIFVSGGFGRYSEYARKILKVFHQFTPVVQMASQDEGYLDMSGTERLWGPPLAAAHRVRQEILNMTGLPCSVGAASNKMVAKIASGLCKPKGLLWVPMGNEGEFLAPLPVGQIPGVGRKTEERLTTLGIRYVRDLQRLGRAELVRLFGRNGEVLHDAAHGIGYSQVETESDRKSLGAEETFDRDISDREKLEAIVLALSGKVARRLRAEGLSAMTISIKYRYEDFETHTAARSLAAPVCDDLAIAGIARELLEEKRDPARPLRLVGVTASNFAESQQGDLLAELPDNARTTRLMQAMDALASRHGDAVVRRGGVVGRPER
jgi:DNA polymerase-4